MKIIEIKIPEETVNLERTRAEAMRSEDFVWCVGVFFSFAENSLLLDASLFGFLKKLFEGLKAVRNDGQPIFLDDEYGAYQIRLACEGDIIHLNDAFGNGSASLLFAPLLAGAKAEFVKATKELEIKIPSYQTNGDYRKIKTEIEMSIQELAQLGNVII